MRYFEDLVVGTVARFGDYAVTREEVLDFARRFDPQPFHLDDDAAAATHFGRLAASGWHTAAMTMAMLVAQMSETAEASLGSPGLDELKWLRPVHPGDRLRVETELLEKRPSASRPGLGLTKSRTTTFNQDGVAVLTFVANGMIRTRPAGG
ncbi:MaoC family dehydratase [Sphingomonas abaci]|uniref:Acyl dehydratase n=1 Tax=Sphingomonas abaci TaxID=237611 RepID=A0A7W7AGB1_9SPHN|nr:MaoC family dehydratase [Sphingomonas abaci]MBB4616431.1 acyl dehydratase [Sphingomonas abaci]